MMPAAAAPPPPPPSPRPRFKPTLILHGGAGAIRRSTLPPDLYARYHDSLLSYLRSTYAQLNNGATALDAAVHAVSLMEDDELFNCGRGSVFTSAGTIEMEASVMVTSAVRDPGEAGNEMIKRGAGVIQVKNVRNPIRLARELLLRTGYDADGEPNGDGGNMHCQLSGPYVETLAREWGLEFKPDEWFWTKRRWEEHRRGLEGKEEEITMSQGTVGCVCLDQWGNLAVATSTGGMTNKKPGRVGDTPTLGAGFWAEAWEVVREADVDAVAADAEGVRMVYRPQSSPSGSMGPLNSNPALHSSSTPWSSLVSDIRSLLGDCLPLPLRPSLESPPPYTYTPIAQHPSPSPPPYDYHKNPPSSIPMKKKKPKTTRRAIALSGTGNGDSFLRINAARTVAAMLRFSSPDSFPTTLAEAVTAVAGPDGELERSAGKRWGKTGEGIGGMIGIEVEVDVDSDADAAGEKKGEEGLRKGKVVFDFNCGGMFRAWMEEVDGGRKGETERVMVFREEYRV